MKTPILAGLITFSFFISVSAQKYSADEQVLAAKMKADGVPEGTIKKLIQQRQELEKSGRTVITTSLKNPQPFGMCSDIGVENGWGAWTGIVGTHNSSGPPVFGAQPWPVPPAPNFSITAGTSIDPCTPGTAPGSPSVPIVAPGFGSNSISLGVPQATGCVAEQMTFPLTVTASDTDFTYSCAMVIQDAGHAVGEQPFVSLCIYDAGGNPIPCGCFTYTGGPSIPGFYTATCGFNTFYQPWATAGVNLANYVGQTLNVVLTNADCSQCGHFAHSYWDFSCGKNSIDFCAGSPVTICAPSHPAIAYTYQWNQNGNIMPGQTAACLSVPAPQAGDVYSVSVKQPSGCNFFMSYQLQDTCSSSFYVSTTTTSSCNNTGTATATPHNGTGPYTYLWQPGGQTTQTATGLSPGTYTVTVTDGNSLTDVAGANVANAISGSISSVTGVSCFGGNNGAASVSVSGGNSPYSYNWSNGQTTQTATGLTAGSYTVIVANSLGCSATVSVLVPGSPMMNSNLNYTPSSCSSCPDGSAVTNVIGGSPPYTYAWSPGMQTTPSITGLIPGGYTVCITDANNCTRCDSVYIWVVNVNEMVANSVTLYPNPASANVFLDFGNKNFGQAEVRISDIIGQPVFHSWLPASGSQPVDISGFSKGIYFVHLKTESGSTTKKLVIAK